MLICIQVTKIKRKIMNNNELPQPDINTRVEAYGEMEHNPLEGRGLPGVRVEEVTVQEIRSGQVVPVEKSKPLFTIGPDDPRFAELMSKHQNRVDTIRAAANGAVVKGTRL